MDFGDQYVIRLDDARPADLKSAEAMNGLQGNQLRITRVSKTGDEDYFDDPEALATVSSPSDETVMFKVDADGLIEITNTRVPAPLLCRNRVGDTLSFQFVTRVARSETLGETTREHSLGPAIICTAVRDSIMSYRVPKRGEPSKYVVVHTTLSNLFERLGENLDDYPRWIIECLEGKRSGQVQRVLFSDPNHRDLVANCFQLPVGGQLRKKWLTAKFWELLTIGLQSLKNRIPYQSGQPTDKSTPELERLNRARRIIEREYVDPPSLESISSRLGLSQTRLKSGFKEVFGMTVMQYCLQKRVDAAKLLLAERHLSISQIADTVGYEDPSAFSRAFRRVTDQSPQEWRQGGGE
ncbi:MAG: AraC family transcriptional regulator [Xanthomonadales bacterium]|nr:AraC family transcriptional regulator [Xanthomonadales bacterium]